MKRPSFNALVEDVVLTVYDRAVRYGSNLCNLPSAFEAMNIEADRIKVKAVGDAIVKLGLGEVKPIGSEQILTFTINERGKAEAIGIYERRRLKTLLARVHALNWATWGGIAAIIAAVASVAALLKK